ncbi:hypothetical protein VM1G_03630 [Cytospora mali]|uniref:DUF6604 domain-containing protein n=1 Tax=Cytospora mali TaxID=578113 RepID=A0A194VU48_CYTMA|nr:hypothetical protein VM1G_03630 [Valsa mali]
MPHYNSNAGLSTTVLLRRITIFTFPVSLLMLTIHGVGSRWAFPALGLLPHATSVVFGSLLLYRERVAALGSPIQALSPSNIFFADVALAVWYLAFLIPTWVLLGAPRDEGWIILGTYGSVFLIVNFTIHLYFAAAEALHIITARQTPFRSLATEYTRLNEDYTDELGYTEAVTGILCGAPSSLTATPNDASSDVKSTRLKGKERKLAKQQAADEFIDATTRQRAPKLELYSYVPLAEIIAKSTSVHSRVPRWVIRIIDKIIQDRQDCFQHINGEDVATFLSKGQYDGHIHPINVLEQVRSILVLKYEAQVALTQKKAQAQPKTPVRRALGEISGNAFAKLKIDSPEETPSPTAHLASQTEEADAQDRAQVDAWRTSLGIARVFAAYPQASHEEALVALGSLRKDMISMRQVVHEAWRRYKNGTTDLAAAATTTNTAIDLARSLEKQARPVIESYIRSRDPKETQLPVYFYSLGNWFRHIDDKTCGTNIYVMLLGFDTPDQTEVPPELRTLDTTRARDAEVITFRWAYKLVQMYCMEFFSQTKKLEMPPDYEPIRWGKGDRPNDAKLFEFVRTCDRQDVQWLYELSWLGNYGYGPVFPIIDEVSRGFRVMHEEVDLKLWVVFGVQLFHEINLILTPDEKVGALQTVDKFMRDGCEMFDKAEDFYASIIEKSHEGKLDQDEEDSPHLRARAGKTLLACLFPSQVDEDIESSGHHDYPNLNQSYLMSQHPTLCGILLHTGRLVLQERSIAVENYTRSILKMAHFYNACYSEGLIKSRWLDLEYCMKELQGPNLFMTGSPPGKIQNYGRAYLLAAGALSLTYAAPDCREGPKLAGYSTRGRHTIKGRRNNCGKTLQKLGKVSMMFEDRFCHTGERYDLNEEDVRAIAEHAAAYKRGDDPDGRSKAQPKTSRAVIKKTKSLDEILRDLCEGLNHEVPMISFPYISLNNDCSTILWDLETELQFTHHLVFDINTAFYGLGQNAVNLLVNHRSKLWIAAKRINKHTKDSTNGGNDGMAGLLWAFSTVSEPLRDTFPKRIQGYIWKSVSRTGDIGKGIGPRPVNCNAVPQVIQGSADDKQYGVPRMTGNARDTVGQTQDETEVVTGKEASVAYHVDGTKPMCKIVYQSHYERYD